MRAAFALPSVALLLLLTPVAASAQVDEVRNFTAVVNQAGRVELTWTNPQRSDGFVIVRRSATPPAYIPHNRQGTPPPIGQVKEESGTFVIATVTTAGIPTTPNAKSGFIDTLAQGPTPSPGTVFHYKIFNARARPRGNGYDFSPGSVPTVNGIAVRPLGRTRDALRWCASVGLSNFARPVVQPGVRAMTIGNLGALISHRSSDGVETWRPFQLADAVQARPIYSTLFQGSGGTPHIFTGDQKGNAYRINASTGQEVWRRTSFQVFGSPAGDDMPIQASPVAQFAGVNGSTAPVDLVFYGSRTGAMNNRVVALRNDGIRHWAYAGPAGIGLADVTGEMLVDYANNRLWIPTTSANGSLHIVTSLSGARLPGPVTLPAGSEPGPIRHGIVLGDVVRDENGSVVDTMVLVAADDGIWGFRRNTMAYLWHVPLPSRPNAHVLPLQGGFIVAFGNTVRRYRFPAGASAQTPVQMGNDVTVAGQVSAMRLVGSHFVFSAGNTLYEVDGYMTIQGQYTLPSTGTISAPQEDGPSLVVVGTQDGRLCAVALPLPRFAP